MKINFLAYLTFVVVFLKNILLIHIVFEPIQCYLYDISIYFGDHRRQTLYISYIINVFFIFIFKGTGRRVYNRQTEGTYTVD